MLVFMNKEKKVFPSYIGIVLVAVIAASSLVVSAVTLSRVQRVNRFFSAISEDYRRVNSLGEYVGAEGGAEGGTAAAPAPAAAPSGGGGSAGQCVNVASLDLGNDPSIGDPNAPVVIVEYSDFECPFCARFWSSTYQQIKNEYIDTGMAQLVFKDFPLDNIHPLATPTAVAANCIYENLGDSEFFDYHDRIFAQQGSLSFDNLQSWALDQGLSQAQLTSCMDDAASRQEITADLNEGSGFGITGTPSFVINGELLIGAQPYNVFSAAIERALAGEGCSS